MLAALLHLNFEFSNFRRILVATLKNDPVVPENVLEQPYSQVASRRKPKLKEFLGVAEQAQVPFLFSFSYFEGVVKVNYLVNELPLSIPTFQLDSVPKLKVSMEYAEFLQLQNPLYQARYPNEHLSLSRLSKIIYVPVTAVAQDKIF